MQSVHSRCLLLLQSMEMAAVVLINNEDVLMRIIVFS